MSYDISLVDPASKEVLRLDHTHQMHGGTYPVGGTDECRLNVTYNYTGYYRQAAEGTDLPATLKKLDGMTAQESIPQLEGLIAALKAMDNDKAVAEELEKRRGMLAEWRAKLEAADDESDRKWLKFMIETLERDLSGPDPAGSYWFPSPINAGKPLYQLLVFARARPDGVWRVE